MIKSSTKKIIKLLEEGKLTQTEIAAKGYPYGTVRYHHRRLNKPNKHIRILKKHNRARREARREKVA